MRISDWSSDVCSSDLYAPDTPATNRPGLFCFPRCRGRSPDLRRHNETNPQEPPMSRKLTTHAAVAASLVALMVAAPAGAADYVQAAGSTLAFATRSEEHTSELQSLMRLSYAVFCLKINTQQHKTKT